MVLLPFQSRSKITAQLPFLSAPGLQERGNEAVDTMPSGPESLGLSEPKTCGLVL